MKKTTTTGFYTNEILKKFATALKEAFEEFRNGKLKCVSVSNRNSKMGEVASVSLLPFLTCPGICKGTCGIKCYAAKLANLRPSVLKSYARNTALAIMAPELYWKQVDKAVKAVRFFRFHVSGDIPSPAYLGKMVEVANNNPNTEILTFTKRFDFVNDWLREHGKLPGNLHILFSGWTNLTPENPFDLPETNVIPKGETLKDGWKMCGGNCFNCACRGVGCWQAQKGDVIAFKMH